MPKYPKISDDKAVQRLYVEARKNGCSHAGAEMLAFQEPPGASGVDNTFLSGTENGKQFAHAPWLGEAYKKISERIKPGCTSGGAVYKSQLARFAGDPRAWVKSISDAKKAAAIKGVDVEGMVNYKAPTSMREKEPVAIAPDLVDQLVKIRVAADPSLAESKKKLKMVRREVQEKHALPSRRQFIKDD